MNVLFMGGTFDPIHCGHLEMARQAVKVYDPDYFLFIPGRSNPLKQAQPGATATQRMRMLQLALEKTDIEIDDWELHREGPSYSWYTLQHLRDRFGSKASLSMIIGDDLLEQLPHWFRWQELQTELEFIVLPRQNSKPGHYPLHYRQLQVPRIQVSSTIVRDTIAAGGDTSMMLPPAISEYILQQQLYGCQNSKMS
jgi:nicotinate-nucleotide adenylyltransferase